MFKRLAIAACGMTLALVGLASGPCAAQEAVLEDFYGSGVHHYFAGDTSAAIADFDAAINGGSRDPRAYYFRGLAKQRAGYGGSDDFQTGAAMEAADTDQYYPVGRSLERIQGSTRLTIERYRSLARATALVHQQRRDTARYKQLRQREQQVLRAPVAGPAAAATAVEPAPVIAEPGASAGVVPAPPVDADPFADDAAAKAADVAPKAADTGPAAPAPVAPAPAVATPTTPSPTTPGSTVPLPPVAEPPAADMPADDDPFGEPPAKDEAPAKDSAPADETPEKEASNEEAPKAEAPAATQEKPAPKPAAPAAPAEEDPFAVPETESPSAAP